MGKKTKKKGKKKVNDKNKKAEAASANSSDEESTISDVDTTTDIEGEAMDFERQNQTQSNSTAQKRKAIRSSTDEDATGILSDHNIDYRKKKAKKDNINTAQTHKPTALAQNNDTNSLQTSNNPQPTPRQSASVNINDSAFLESQPDIRKVHITSTSQQYQLTSLNPCYLKKAIDKITNEIEGVQYLKSSGSLIIQCKTLNQVKKLLETKTFLYKDNIEIPVRVSIAKVSQTVQGKITAPELADMSIEEILGESQHLGVVDVRKMYSSPEKENIPIYVLTFFGATCPTTIKLAYVSYRVDQYIPRIKHCTNCCYYGHTKNFCRNAKICHRCASKEHSTENCTAVEPKCPSCKGQHSAFDKMCPAEQKEQEINKVKTYQNISFAEARDRVSSQNTEQSNNNTQSLEREEIQNINFSKRAFPQLPKSRNTYSSQPNNQVQQTDYNQRQARNRFAWPDEDDANPEATSQTQKTQWFRNSRISQTEQNQTQTRNRYDCLDEIEIVPETPSQAQNTQQSFPSLMTQPESSQKTQWFRKQKSRTFNRRDNREENYQSDSQDEILQILEGNTNSSQRESNRRKTTKTLTPTEEQQQKDIKDQLKELVIPLIPQLLKLLIATDLTTKIEAMLEIAKIFDLQGMIEKAMNEMQITSRIDSSQK